MSVLPSLGYAVGLAVGIHDTDDFAVKNVFKCLQHYGQMEDKKVSRSNLSPSDHIYIPLPRSAKTMGLRFYHHGVYLGKINGKDMVTDFGADSPTPVIREIDVFLGSTKKLYRRNFYLKNMQARSPEKITEYARLISKSGEPWPTHSITSFNSEHYASLLKMAELCSVQAGDSPQDLFHRKFVEQNLGIHILNQSATKK